MKPFFRLFSSYISVEAARKSSKSLRTICYVAHYVGKHEVDPYPKRRPFSSSSCRNVVSSASVNRDTDNGEVITSSSGSLSVRSCESQPVKRVSAAYPSGCFMGVKGLTWKKDMSCVSRLDDVCK